jgi:acyl-[acyl-carrier-protein]-phospholipid O-acyltransferase/long-chain-fatty-acid--[acyl-carrier-protein] ligase
MVSLTATEQLINDIWPDTQHVVVSIPDERKGEQLVLITTQENATSKELIAQTKGVASLNLPKKFITVDHVPVLATGKINYIEAEQACPDYRRADNLA